MWGNLIWHTKLLGSELLIIHGIDRILLGNNFFDSDFSLLKKHSTKQSNFQIRWPSLYHDNENIIEKIANS